MEIQLYMISGLIMWFMYSRKHRILIAAALLVYVLLSFRPVRDGVLTIQTASFAAFACGWFMQRSSDFSIRALAVLTLGGAAAFAAVLAFVSREELLHLNGGLTVSLAFLCYSVASASAIQLLAGKGAPRWAVGTGAFSYTLYIFHFPLLLAASFVLYHKVPELMLIHAVTDAVLASFAIIAICAAFGRLFERPKVQQRFVLDRLKRWRPSGANPPPAAARSTEEAERS